jgi:DNA polymerase-4
MSILYVNAPSFAVALERLRDPPLRRCPLAIAAQAAPRAPILSVSAEAYALGARKGDKVAELRRLDRRIRVLPADHGLYRRAQRQLLQIVARFTPCYQPQRLGSFFLDMSGTERLFGKIPDAAAKLQSEAARVLGLRFTLGAAENKLVSRIAAKVVRPDGFCDIFPGNEAAFLSPLGLYYLPALRQIPHPELFRELAIRRIGDLAEVPTAVLTHIFGRHAEVLKLQAQGIDGSAVEAPEAEATLRRELLLSPETNDDAALLARLWQAVEVLARRLRERRQQAGEIRLHAIYGDQQRISRAWSVTPPSQLDFSLFAVLRANWRRFLKRRVALKSLELVFARLVPEFCQLRFGEDDREARLCAALDELRARYGPGAVRIGRGEG